MSEAIFRNIHYVWPSPASSPCGKKASMPFHSLQGGEDPLLLDNDKDDHILAEYWEATLEEMESSSAPSRLSKKPRLLFDEASLEDRKHDGFPDNHNLHGALSVEHQQPSALPMGLAPSLRPIQLQPTGRGNPVGGATRKILDGVSGALSKTRLVLIGNAGGEPLLHQSCRLFPTNKMIVETALMQEPWTVHQASPLAFSMSSLGPTHKKRSQFKTFCQIPPGTIRTMDNSSDSRYRYALNVALSHGASLEVVQMLAQAAPEVLLLPDCQGHTSLHVILRSKSCSITKKWRLVQVLLSCNLLAGMTYDCNQNSPLHMACQCAVLGTRTSKRNPSCLGADALSASAALYALEMIQLLYHANPQALYQPNRWGDTPLDIARRSLTCSEAIVDFLNQQAGLQ